MTTKLQAPRGTQDVLPAAQPYWDAVLQAAKDVATLHGFQRIDTPVFEYAAVFEKGSGDTTDIVEKEMYTFEDRGGDLLALTPEGTPAICRAYLEHGMASWPQPVRLYTTHQMFRYDRPQKGRYRQHTQIDCEVIGSYDALTDAGCIVLLWEIFQRLGLSGIEVRLGSIDDPGPRKAYTERLKAYYRPHLDQLSEDSQRRFERNPLRLLDSKDERDLALKDGAPKLVDQLSAPAEEHHAAVCSALEAAGIAYRIDPMLVRGLDYYNRTVFEIVPTDDERAQGTLGGGGRYDGLMEILGGPPTGAMGFGSGVERIILEMEKNGITFDAQAHAGVFIVQRAPGSQGTAFRLATDLRAGGIATIVGEGGRSMKSQLRSANASGARTAVILGEDEMARGVAVVKDLRDGGNQHETALGEVVTAVRQLAP
ncbi:MAG TPA: histidine--tRNA ligase [Tepidiformaceae bacterium]|nr:histidine--tRNA ligase [Tepidiformaceae bacterium]